MGKVVYLEQALYEVAKALSPDLPDCIVHVSLGSAPYLIL